MKNRDKVRLVASIFNSVMRMQVVLVPLALMFVFNGCRALTALEEAQQRREKRILEERNASSLMLKPSKATIKITPNALRGESDHYTLTFADDLRVLEGFDEVKEREIFTRSALGYMESLYDAMNRLFGFQTESIRFT